MRSIVGVGMTPPKVLGTPKPASSVMISSTFGAPFGGTMRGAHHGFDCSASSLMTPPNFGSGGGSCLPSIVVVAPASQAAGLLRENGKGDRESEGDQAEAEPLRLHSEASLPRSRSAKLG